MHLQEPRLPTEPNPIHVLACTMGCSSATLQRHAVKIFLSKDVPILRERLTRSPSLMQPQLHGIILGRTGPLGLKHPSLLCRGLAAYYPSYQTGLHRLSRRSSANLAVGKEVIGLEPPSDSHASHSQYASKHRRSIWGRSEADSILFVRSGGLSRHRVCPCLERSSI